MAAWLRLSGTRVDVGEGQARWMTQFTAHRPETKRQFTVRATDSTTTCVCASVCASVIEFLQIFLLMRPFSCPDNKPGKPAPR